MTADGFFQPGGTERGQVRSHAFSAGQNDQVRISPFLPCPHLAEPDVRLRRQRGEVREVGDVGGHDYGHIQAIRMFPVLPVARGQRGAVFFRNVDVPHHRDDAQHRLARTVPHVAVRRGQQIRISSKFVDHEPRQQFFFPRGECHPRSQKGGVHSATVNVPGEQNPGTRVAGHVHVDHVC